MSDRQDRYSIDSTPKARAGAPRTSRPRMRAGAQALRQALLLGAVATLGLAGTAHAAPAARAADENATAQRAAKAVLPDVPLTSDIFYRVLAAEVSLQRGLIGPSYRTYMDLARDTRDPRFAQRATEIAFSARLSQQALDAARLWTDLAPRSGPARQVLSTLLVLSGRWEDAEPLLAHQLAETPASQRPEAILQLQQQLSRTADPAGAAAMLQRLTANDARLPETQLALARARETAGDVPGALAALDEALHLRPGYEAAALMAAELRADSAPGEAIAGLQRFLAKAPGSVNGHIMLARLYLQRGETAPARKEFETLRKIAPTDPRVPLALGLTSLQAKRYGEAEQYLKEYLRLVETVPGASPDVAYQYLAEIAEQRKDYQGALGWLDRIDDSRLETAVAVKRAQLLARMGKLDEADAVYADMIADTEDISDPVLRGQRLTAIRQAEIAMLLDAKAYDRARKALGERIAAEPDNADWIYELAMLDEREKRYDSMEKGLRKVIALQPDQKQGYNALGYSLADRNQRLPEALKLLEKASELGPDDPYIMDSLGWVKFRLGQLQPAAELLRNAYAKAPEAEIGAHLGEVLWQLGQREEARQMWAEAAKTEPDNEVLIDTLRRYNVTLTK
ncbi:hypothetical protein BKK79_08660 [Cupriavidus sp. USMAA2-4]|uniref:tetratricopeptide repeat protein n=1 Tax=Cupriavidus sp. USMAA2-4 TaxID=876364 RepID=UPI0008A6D111|nr:tetratricopeptide repeat protein [Cupriavidus sp. USMAA2-4]AOY91860.1 hypothetical protein BKK79_08660 [Cupriavidus sp. USMAA2-4]